MDYGKAQIASASRKYNLTEEQKEMYRTHHSHIAPELIDGSSKPSYSSDMFSFGRIFKSVMHYFPLPATELPKEIVTIVKKCLCYNPLKRPSAKTVFREFSSD